MAERVSLCIEDDCHIVELCAPPRNETDLLFFSEFDDVVDELHRDESTIGVIVKGKGKHFSSGANIEEIISLSTKKGKETLISERSIKTLRGLHKIKRPVIAAIQGCCLGSGLELALGCHFRVATKTALFGFPESGYGLIPGWGGTVRLPQLVGKGKSIEMILSGSNYLAEDALAMGLIDLVVQKSNLMSSAKSMVHRFT